MTGMAVMERHCLECEETTACYLSSFDDRDEVHGECGLCGNFEKLPLGTMHYAHDLMEASSEAPVFMEGVECPHCDEGMLLAYRNDHGSIVVCKGCGKVVQSEGN